jgi:hypothetical protein
LEADAQGARASSNEAAQAMKAFVETRLAGGSGRRRGA